MRKIVAAKFFFMTCVGGLLVSLSSCGGADHEAQNASDTLATAEAQQGPEVYYQVPLPGDFFSNLKSLGLSSKPGILNPSENISKYTSSTDKALNFGVYSTDLFFCSMFDQKADILSYFNNMKRLADDLGISAVVTDQTIKRIEANLSNKDSLNHITSEVFYDATAALENNGQGATLALVIAGGLTESIYLSTRLVDSYKDGSAAIQLIADQKFPLDNLFSYFEKYPEDTRIPQVADKLSPLHNVFNSLTETPKQANTSNDGRKVIGSETVIMLNADDYKHISDAAASVRNSITQSGNR